MISGTIENNRYPYVTLPLLANKTSETFKFLVDTGFDGDIGLHYTKAFKLKLPFQNVIQVDYADGESRLELVCRASIIWNGEERIVNVVLSYDEQPALGTNLLADCVILINFAHGDLIIDKVDLKA